MSLQILLAYLAAVLVLTVTPGPSVLMCVTTAVNHGPRRALWAALGSITAVLAIMSLSALGLGALLAASERAFTVLKWAGAAYLFYIGWQTFRAEGAGFEVPAASGDVQPGVARRRLYLQGLMVGGSNPKALLFFTALFPQFLNPAAPQGPQFAILGLVFVAFELFWLMFYANFAARLAPWLRVKQRMRWFNRACGSVFMGAALLLSGLKRSPG